VNSRASLRSTLIERLEKLGIEVRFTTPAHLPQVIHLVEMAIGQL